MGVWGTNLFANDTTSDIRDTYIQFLKKGLSNEDAFQRTRDYFNELIGTEDEPLFWYALADIQWDLGRLLPNVKHKAMQFLQKNSSFFLYEESPDMLIQWKKTLKKLKEKIESPMPVEKIIDHYTDFKRNPWNIGDIYAYKLHSKKAIEAEVSGKYILFQKVGNVEYYEDTIFSVIQVFDKIFETVPNSEVIHDIRILPLIYSPITKGYPSSTDDYIPAFKWFLKATMIYENKNDYPKQYLTYVGKIQLPETHFNGNDFTDFYWHKSAMEDWIIDYYLSWRNVNY